MTAIDQATFLQQLKAFEGREVGGWDKGLTPSTRR